MIVSKQGCTQLDGRKSDTPYTERYEKSGMLLVISDQYLEKVTKSLKSLGPFKPTEPTTRGTHRLSTKKSRGKRSALN